VTKDLPLVGGNLHPAIVELGIQVSRLPSVGMHPISGKSKSRMPDICEGPDIRPDTWLDNYPYIFCKISNKFAKFYNCYSCFHKH
jgi:hypothetical protein